jgi:flagellar hook protein FlgE
MGFQQGLSGLNSATRDLDVIGNNVANSTTVGFKGSEAQFADVYANSLSGAGAGQIGIGSKLATVAQMFSQGTITATNNPLDIAINGKGFFRMDSNGAITYARNGQFQFDKDGYIVNSARMRLTGYGVDANGNILTASPSPIQVSFADIAPNATTDFNLSANLDSRAVPPVVATFDPTDPTSYTASTSGTVYDTLGNCGPPWTERRSRTSIWVRGRGYPPPLTSVHRAH